MFTTLTPGLEKLRSGPEVVGGEEGGHDSPPPVQLHRVSHRVQVGVVVTSSRIKFKMLKQTFVVINYRFACTGLFVKIFTLIHVLSSFMVVVLCLNKFRLGSSKCRQEFN